MKSVQEFLAERRNVCCHNILCCSKNYLMNEAKPGREQEFEEALRDLEIVEELKQLVESSDKHLK